MVISASHNPWTDNGIKVFSGDGYKLPDAHELAIEQEIFALLRDRSPGYTLGKARRLACPAKRSCVTPTSNGWARVWPRI